MAYKYLVIVESPAKAKTIEKYLGKNYKVVASKGHIRDLPKSRMGVDFENDYEPDYITIRGKGPLLKELKSQAKKAEKVFLAADPDREGEAIAWHLSYALKLDPKAENRVIFNEITKEAVKNAFKEPRALDEKLIDSQQARRILDRIVGYKISPILWKKVKKGLSAGRVQSIALKLIVDRENEIKNFNPEEYWSIDGTFKKDKETFQANFYGLDGKKKDLVNAEEVKEVMDKIKSEDWNVEKVTKKERRRNPFLPFKTSSLQQDAVGKLNFRTGKTMMIAQQLYEGVSLGRKGSIGLITYMRTDSTRISPTAILEANEYIEDQFGKEYTGSKAKNVKKDEKIQDAHEGIRPSSVLRTPEEIKKYLTADQYKLYKLIWERFVASQMSPAVYDTMRVDLEQNGVNFRANGSKIKFEGFQKVYKKASAEKENMLPDMETGDVVQSNSLEEEQHFTQPPARFSEATLIKALEDNGVGRPSTFAPTLNTVQKRYYATIKNKRFEPTDLGVIVDELVRDFFPNIVDITFTAEMEKDLDKVEEGTKEWISVIDAFYQNFEKEVENAEENIEKIQIKDEPAGFDCEKCGHPMVIKIGRYGKFYACSNFPECRNTKAIIKEIGVTCPLCKEGQVVERKSKKKRIFYGCSLYPECEFTSWNKPVGRECPRCDHFLVEKKKRGSSQVICEKCDYSEDEQK